MKTSKFRLSKGRLITPTAIDMSEAMLASCEIYCYTFQMFNVAELQPESTFEALTRLPPPEDPDCPLHLHLILN